MGQVADPGAAPDRDLDQLLDRGDLVAVVGPHQRQVPLAPVERGGLGGLQRRAHLGRGAPDLRLCVGVAAQVPEVLPLGRGHDHGVPHEGLQQPVRHLLVDVEPLRRLRLVADRRLDPLEQGERLLPRRRLRAGDQAEHAAHGVVAGAQPLALCRLPRLAAECRAGLHAGLVGAELDRHEGALEHPAQLFDDRDRPRAGRVAREDAVRVELGQDEAGEGHLEGREPVPGGRAGVGEDPGVEIGRHRSQALNRHGRNARTRVAAGPP